MSIQCCLREQPLARRQFRIRVLEPLSAYVLVRWDTDGEFELAREMKWAVAGDSSEVCERDVVPTPYQS